MDKTKVKLASAIIPGIGLPLMRAGVNHHFSMKRLKKREEMEIQKAEKRREAARELARMGRQDRGEPQPVEPEPLEGSPGDVYDELEEIRASTNCRFCRTTAEELMEAPPEEARRGAAELQQYLSEVERIEGHDLDEEEAQRIVDDLVSGWEVAPKYATGMA